MKTLKKIFDMNSIEFVLSKLNWGSAMNFLLTSFSIS